MTAGRAEPSLAVEILARRARGGPWLTSGWSLDAITTPTRGGLGIAKDLSRRRAGLGVNLGAYATQSYSGLLRGRLDPAIGVGLNVRF